MNPWKCLHISVVLALVLVLFGAAAPIFTGDKEDGSHSTPVVEKALDPRLTSPSPNVPAVTRWTDPLNRRPLKHTVQTVTESFRIRKVEPAVQDKARRDMTNATAALGRVCIVVHEDVYDLIVDGLGQYEADLAARGYEVMTHVFVSGPPEPLRAYLAQLYAEQKSLAGAVFVGEIPHVLFEMYDDFQEAPHTYTDFPCDLFFMDLDGEWSDSLTDGKVQAANGRYDTWTGNRDLEIWVCRLKPANLVELNTLNLPPANFQAYILNSYFRKNHLYRVGSTVPSFNGLVYDDDRWAGFEADDMKALAMVFGESNVTSVVDPDLTTKEDYLYNRLPAAPQLILLRSDGFSGGHLFNPDSEYVTTEDYRRAAPRTPFFSLYVCNGSDYTAENNLAGTIVLDPDDSTLLAWGSTKTGSMWNDMPFYEALAQGQVFGEAFKRWFNKMSEDYAFLPQFVQKWWGGMVLIGDATLKPAMFIADLEARSTSGKVPLRIKFMDRTAGSLGPPAEWRWDFGDGGTSTSRDPVYIYKTAGTYTVRLTVTAHDGTTSSREYVRFVNAYATPRSIFTATPTRGRAPLAVNFVNKSTGSITNWVWDFGNGQTSSVQSPIHIYDKSGSYTVKLTVSGPGGTHTASRRISALK